MEELYTQMEKAKTALGLVSAKGRESIDAMALVFHYLDAAQEMLVTIVRQQEAVQREKEALEATEDNDG